MLFRPIPKRGNSFDWIDGRSNHDDGTKANYDSTFVYNEDTFMLLLT